MLNLRQATKLSSSPALSARHCTFKPESLPTSDLQDRCSSLTIHDRYNERLRSRLELHADDAVKGHFNDVTGRACIDAPKRKFRMADGVAPGPEPAVKGDREART